MGDDELNFTEEEARDWDRDPRNQAQKSAMFVRPLAVFLLIVAAALIVVWLASRAVVEYRPATHPVSGVPAARAVNAQPVKQSLHVRPDRRLPVLPPALLPASGRFVSTSKEEAVHANEATYRRHRRGAA